MVMISGADFRRGQARAAPRESHLEEPSGWQFGNVFFVRDAGVFV